MAIIKPDIDLKDYESGLAKFDSLMQFKVKDILLVSSLYDSFILEEDGHLAQLIFNEYLELNLSYAPQIKQVSTGEEALEILRKKRYDLVIIFRQPGDVDVISFGQKVRELYDDLPIGLLAFHPRELEITNHRHFHKAVDKSFLWSGESNILLAIVKYFEDKLNVDFDTRLIGVRVIILIEDSVRFYSSYLPLIYSEIMRQTQALMSDGMNLSHKLLRMRARPKILHATTLEEAWRLFTKYKKCVLGIISDIRFQNDGVLDDKAGLKFTKRAKEMMPDLPILLQSSNLQNAELAHKYEIAFIHKNSPTLLTELSEFIKNNFGFGDFVFRDSKGGEIKRAQDFLSMERALEKVPDESILYHAYRNHFSNWVMARTEFDLANRLRPRKVSEFKDTKTLRSHLINAFKDFRREKQLGIITDFSRKQFDLQSEFVRIGDGSLGGKGRGLAFINRLLRRYNVYDCFNGVRINVPPSAIIGTSIFDQFLSQNGLLDFALSGHSDHEIAEKFVNAKLPKDIESDLRTFLNVVKFPIAVRSSSLLEDSHYQPFAGIFDTHMLPNCHANNKIRMERLKTAVKYIYASIFFKRSRNYIEATGNRVEEEKMAIVLQKVVGSDHYGTFYPTLSGIARSYNFYSIGNIKPEEGVAYAALGLGMTIVDGRDCLYFSPSNPNNLPQFSTPKDFLKNSQHEFYAIDMNDPGIIPKPGGQSGLTIMRIDEAERHGTLSFVGSTYSPDNDRIYDGTSRKGIKIVTFAPILKSKIFPLDEIIRFLLQLGSKGMNFPVEIEFAAELNRDPKIPDEFGFLQIRPMAMGTTFKDMAKLNFDRSRIFCKSSASLSHGRINTIKDIIYIRPDNFNRAQTPEMARQVGSFNDYFKSENKPYLLIGPGRWGTADRWLGIPTSWDQISSARVIIETAYGDFDITPSFGTHFFQNLIAFQIGYLTIGKNNDKNSIDWDWLTSLPVERETEFIRHVVLEKPLEVIINGRDGNAVILKPNEIDEDSES
ncbi:MAG: PEP/pyruvate-binding domain-containing protein [Candidatus Zixiibacteriota bacterium]